MARTPEGRVKDAIKAALERLGAYWYMPVSRGMGRAGAPDFFVCVGGRFVGIEAKAPGRLRTLSAAQQRELNKIRAAGGVGLVIDTETGVDDAISAVLNGREEEL